MAPAPVPAESREALRRIVSSTRLDPVWFIRRLLREDPWSGQKEIARAVFQQRQVAVKACHSSGKTRIAAATALAFFYAYPGCKILTTAPTWLQVERLLWGELAALHQRLPRDLRVTLNQSELRAGPDWWALGLSTDEAVRFQGHHARKMLVILDEAPGVRPEIYEALQGIQASGDVHVLLIGNPTASSGPFYDAFTSQRAGWRCLTIDAFATPNLQGLFPPGVDTASLADAEVAEALLALDEDDLDRNPRPYLAARRWAKDIYLNAGPSSPEWQSRVRGRFPVEGEGQLISLAWLEEARRAGAMADEGKEPVCAGIDVAGPGEDETVVYVVAGRKILSWRAWSKPDSRGDVVAFLSRYLGRFERINVDSAGIGWHFYTFLKDRLTEETEKKGISNPGGLSVVRPVNVGEAASNKERFCNRKASLYWGLRERFQQHDVVGLTDEVAIAQLASIRYEQTPRGQVQIEGKEVARRRGVKSPDRAEALMLAYAQDDTPGIIQYYQRLVEERDRQDQTAPG